MRNIILMLLLALVSSNAKAGWNSVGTVKGTTLYYDPATLQRNLGNTVEMWSLLDYKTVQKVREKVYLSSKTLYEFDCVLQEYRILSRSYHSGSMGEGKVVASINKFREWQLMPPETIISVLIKIACL